MMMEFIKHVMRTPTHHVMVIREVFGLTIADLSLIINVPRPTIYSWFQGRDPQPFVIPKLRYLFMMAEEAKKYEIERLGALVSRRLFRGLSFIDLLKREEPKAKIKVALLTLKTLSKQENDDTTRSTHSYENPEGARFGVGVD